MAGERFQAWLGQPVSQWSPRIQLQRQRNPKMPRWKERKRHATQRLLPCLCCWCRLWCLCRLEVSAIYSYINAISGSGVHEQKLAAIYHALTAVLRQFWLMHPAGSSSFSPFRMSLVSEHRNPLSSLFWRCNPTTRTSTLDFKFQASATLQRLRLHWRTHGKAKAGPDPPDPPMIFSVSILVQYFSIGQAWGPVTRKLASGAKTSTRHWSEAVRVVGIPVPFNRLRPQMRSLTCPKMALMRRTHQGSALSHMIWGLIWHLDTSWHLAGNTSDILRPRTSEHSAHNSDSDSSGLSSKLRAR